MEGIGRQNPHDIRSLWKMGFGAVNVNSILTVGSYEATAANVLGYILLANMPQTILSLLYLMYNSLYTCMLQADEWSHYAHNRKGLRVTAPVGKQRSTYYLTLPYTYAVPLLVFSGLMHWLVSQSIFLARITLFTLDGMEDAENSIATCGYSSIAIIFVLIVGGTMLLISLAAGFRRFKPGIPLASSCSAAISAACHAPRGDVDAPVLPVMWGVVKEEVNGVGHCSFTSDEAVLPVKTRLYAGKVEAPLCSIDHHLNGSTVRRRRRR
ncbi:MAG: hypothetical protein M1830_008875 [Pleopsidium flavum]|nr:MAG: hypothetical protein M1830_008875 [Pleopsidium flavum]